jgi:single-strand DNA-binding protein
MAKDLNRVMITGRLGGDPESRYTPGGTMVANFRVASNRTWKTQGGEAQEEATWFRIVAWNKLAEICNEYLTKGTRVYIEGRLQERKYTDRDGNERFTWEVVAEDMIILSARGERADVPDAPDAGPIPVDDGDDGLFESGAPRQAVPAARPQNRSGQGNAPARQAAVPARNMPRPVSTHDDDPFS